MNYSTTEREFIGIGVGLPKISPVFAWDHSSGRNGPSTLSLIDTQEPSAGSSIAMGISIRGVQIHHDICV